ncbi:hypothetical protein [Desulfobacter postgatei]|uniref:hypothetical protein n=1 Tax=Desulfobacter postgatei TaxID=2293 RepID=UPI00259B1F73|nr:hypothetical protein [uncultured Desulfobacter sp.]
MPPKPCCPHAPGCHVFFFPGRRSDPGHASPGRRPVLGGFNGLSEEMITQIAILDITLVRKILNNEPVPVEIPLHLLSDSETQHEPKF